MTSYHVWLIVAAILLAGPSMRGVVNALGGIASALSGIATELRRTREALERLEKRRP